MWARADAKTSQLFTANHSTTPSHHPPQTHTREILNLTKPSLTTYQNITLITQQMIATATNVINTDRSSFENAGIERRDSSLRLRLSSRSSLDSVLSFWYLNCQVWSKRFGLDYTRNVVKSKACIHTTKSNNNNFPSVSVLL